METTLSFHYYSVILKVFYNCINIFAFVLTETDIRLFRRQFKAHLLSPFLNIRMIFPSFQSYGTILSVSDLLDIVVKGNINFQPIGWPECAYWTIRWPSLPSLRENQYRFLGLHQVRIF